VTRLTPEVKPSKTSRIWTIVHDLFSKKDKRPREEILPQERATTTSDNHIQTAVAIQRDIQPETEGDCVVQETANESKMPPRIKSEIKRIEDELERIDNWSDEPELHVFREERIHKLKRQLENLETIPMDEEQKCRFYHCLALSHTKLGTHRLAHYLYSVAVPYLCFEPDDPQLNDIELFCTRFKNGFREYHIGVLLHYFELTVETAQNLDITERILGILPWIASVIGDISFKESDTRKLTLLAIQASNARRNFHEAFTHLCRYEIMFSSSIDDINTGLVALEKAKVYANKEPSIFRDAARSAFVYSLTTSTILCGIWHKTTLEALYHFGIALMQWGNEEASCIVLEECCLGAWYRFGSKHEYFTRVRDELEKCDESASSMRTLAHFIALEDRERSSVTYEHLFINTIVDLLWHVPDVDFAGLLDALIRTRMVTEGSPLRRRRILARCEENNRDFRASLETLNPDVSVTWDMVVLKLDEIRIISQDKGIGAASDEARNLLCQFRTMSLEIYNVEKFNAVKQRLVALGVTHFTPKQPSAGLTLVEEQDSDILGTGTYALVHSIKVGHELYARKSVALPRFRQNQVRGVIQNELSVTRKLIHPHTIRVFFTYEERDRFYIVMEPVADCDLEAFLIQHSSTYITWDQLLMVLKWFRCLTNTLAFIHSKGIRHKDIKPRNILVKNADIIFADFGSSHAFLEEGDSTTEGPSYGHTKKYCPPEVINQGKRNRAADIFSLGCVFTELAIWLAGSKGLDIHKWHEYRETKIDNITTSSYHATLDKVEQWFRTCADTDVQTLYNDVIGRMLCTDPYDRPTAAEVSQLVIEIIKDDDLGDIACSKCRLDLWLDVPTNMAPRHAVVTSAEKILDYKS
jgi:hypothetical protein